MCRASKFRIPVAFQTNSSFVDFRKESAGMRYVALRILNMPTMFPVLLGWPLALRIRSILAYVSTNGRIYGISDSPLRSLSCSATFSSIVI